VVVEDQVTMQSNFHLAGNVRILHPGDLEMGCVIHQSSVIGASIMPGMGSVVTKTVPRIFTFYAGKARKLNAIDVHRMGHS
jgi:acyl-[acyl carrier protein]--UDP-N-acetylglucosamine O-acyltransferase